MDVGYGYEVALFMGAWIETGQVILIVNDILSHSSWVRGLKHLDNVMSRIKRRSHSSWVRGLKLPNEILLRTVPTVALFMGAWIETPCSPARPHDRKVALFMGAWIETSGLKEYSFCLNVALFMGAWVETGICDRDRTWGGVDLFTGAGMETTI